MVGYILRSCVTAHRQSTVQASINWTWLRVTCLLQPTRYHQLVTHSCNCMEKYTGITYAEAYLDYLLASDVHLNVILTVSVAVI